MNVREIARRAVDGEVVQGDEGQDVLELMMSDERWRLGVAIALEYLARDDVELAKKVLEDMLGDSVDDPEHAV